MNFFHEKYKEAKEKKGRRHPHTYLLFSLSLVFSVFSATSAVNYSGFACGIAAEKVNL